MKYYKSNIADKPNVEVVQVSADNNDKAAERWAKKEKFPFAIVMPSDRAKAELNKYHSGGIPHYLLLDKSGKVIANGYGAVMKKIKTL